MEPTTHRNSDDETAVFRPLTESERNTVVRLLGVDFPGKEALAEQLASAQARTIDAEGSLQFRVSRGPVASVERRIPVEAETDDSDGEVVHVLLHVVNGRLDELEYYREDGEPVIGPLEPARLRVSVF